MSPPDRRPVAILGGNRIPFARRDREYAGASNQDMLTAALDGLVSRFGLQGERVGEVAAGGVLKRSRDFNLTRECVLGSALSPDTPAYEVQQACGTGLETTIHVANKIALGQIESGIAGGVDTTSDAPIELTVTSVFGKAGPTEVAVEPADSAPNMAEYLASTPT